MTEYEWPLMKDTLTFCDKFELAKFVLTTKQFTQGPKVQEFEQEWSQWLNAKHSLFVSSGSTANFLLLAAIIEKYNLKKGDKVLVPACTWVTNINPVFQLGLEPIFCDVNFKDFSFCTIAMEKIAKEHSDIKVVFTTHLLGIPAPVHQFKKFFPDAIHIDDVCEAHGAKDIDGFRVGSHSLGATFSFYFGHHMTTIEGGMICTNNSDLYDIMKMKRSHGLARFSSHFGEYIIDNPDIDKSFLFVTDGYNFRNTEIGAVLGLCQLRKLNGYISIRRRNHKRFVEIMNNHKDKFYRVHENYGNSSFCFPFIAREKKTRNELIKKFKENKIEYRPIVGGNLLRQPYLKYKVEMPLADILHENGVYIGNNQFVTEENMKTLERMVGELS